MRLPHGQSSPITGIRGGKLNAQITLCSLVRAGVPYGVFLRRDLARVGVSGVNITKVHAAYSLGASKFQIMRHVIMPNSLPEIFTGARVAMGVFWGTVVAAELVAASEGAGMMIMVASKFQLTDIVLMGIILIGIIGFGIDILMRRAERFLVPWKGKS